MHALIIQFDRFVIEHIKRLAVPAARIGLFIVFFWFGALKVIAVSPAAELVQALLAETMPGFPAALFIQAFGVFEMVIGTLFLFPRFSRLVIALFAFHMVTTFLPLVLLPQFAWQGFLMPTLEGQYIIKNVVLIALALGVAAHMHPMAATVRPRRRTS